MGQIERPPGLEHSVLERDMKVEAMIRANGPKRSRMQHGLEIECRDSLVVRLPPEQSGIRGEVGFYVAGDGRIFMSVYGQDRSKILLQCVLFPSAEFEILLAPQKQPPRHEGTKED